MKRDFFAVPFLFLLILPLLVTSCGETDGFVDLFLQSVCLLLRLGFVCAKIITKVMEMFKRRVEKEIKFLLPDEKTPLATRIKSAASCVHHDIRP